MIAESDDDDNDAHSRSARRRPVRPAAAAARSALGLGDEAEEGGSQPASDSDGERNWNAGKSKRAREAERRRQESQLRRREQSRKARKRRRQLSESDDSDGDEEEESEASWNSEDEDSEGDKESPVEEEEAQPWELIDTTRPKANGKAPITAAAGAEHKRKAGGRAGDGAAASSSSSCGRGGGSDTTAAVEAPVTVGAARGDWLKRRQRIEAQTEDDSGGERVPAWYTAEVLRHNTKSGRVTVKFDELLTDNEQNQLEEELEPEYLRPVPPKTIPQAAAPPPTTKRGAASGSSAAGVAWELPVSDWLAQLPRGTALELYAEDAWWAGLIVGPGDAADVANEGDGNGTGDVREGEPCYRVQYLHYAGTELTLPEHRLRPLWEYDAERELWTLNAYLYEIQ